jgi:hypothetical protein
MLICILIQPPPQQQQSFHFNSIALIKVTIFSISFSFCVVVGENQAIYCNEREGEATSDQINKRAKD